jgi:hypothetical protein
MGSRGLDLIVSKKGGSVEMPEKTYISAVIETMLELDCDKELIEYATDYFTLQLVADGSFEYVIRKPLYNSKAKIIGYEIIERGNIGTGLAKLLKKYRLIGDIIERMSKEAYHDVIQKCQNLHDLGFD